MRSRLLCVCMCLFVVAGCRIASTPDGGERQETSVAAVRYMASVGGVGAETVEVVLQNGSGNGCGSYRNCRSCRSIGLCYNLG